MPLTRRRDLSYGPIPKTVDMMYPAPTSMNQISDEGRRQEGLQLLKEALVPLTPREEEIKAIRERYLGRPVHRAIEDLIAPPRPNLLAAPRPSPEEFAKDQALEREKAYYGVRMDQGHLPEEDPRIPEYEAQAADKEKLGVGASGRAVQSPTDERMMELFPTLLAMKALRRATKWMGEGSANDPIDLAISRFLGSGRNVENIAPSLRSREEMERGDSAEALFDQAGSRAKYQHIKPNLEMFPMPNYEQDPSAPSKLKLPFYFQ